MEKSWVACALLLCLPATASPQDPPGAAISGRVIEARSSAPIAMAAVRLVDIAGSRERSARTDVHGRYAFSEVPPGSYRITVARPGYRGATLWVDVPSRSRLERSIGLDLDPLPLEAVEVPGAPDGLALWSSRSAPSPLARGPLSVRTAPAREAPLDALSLTTEQIGELSTLGEPDILRALQRLPGVSASGDYSAEIWTRGSPWGMTRVQLDGIPVYAPLHVGGMTSGVSADGLARAQLLPGVRPSSIADGAAGTVRLETRPASEEAGGTAAVSPLAVRVHREDRWSDDRIGLVLTGRRSWWDWIDPPDALLRDHGSGGIDYHYQDLTARFDLRIGDDASLEAGGLWEEDRIDGDIGRVVGDSRARWGNRVGWLALTRAWERDLRLRALLGRTRHAARARSKPWRAFYTPDGVPSLDWMDLDLAQSLVRLEAEGRAADGGLRWGAGWDWTRERLAQDGIEASDWGVPGVRAPATLTRSRGWMQVDAAANLAELSAGVAWDLPLADRLPGSDLFPNARLRVHPARRLTVEAAWGRTRQTAYPLAPSGRSVGPALGAGHVWVLAGDGVPGLTAEMRTAGAELALPGGFGAGVTAWSRRITGLRMAHLTTISEGALQTLSAEDGTGTEQGRGLELSLRRKEGRITGSASYSRQRAELGGPTGETWRSPAERTHSVNAHIAARAWAGLRASAFLAWESGWPYAVGPWACVDVDGCDIPLGDPRRPREHSFERAPSYRSVDLKVDWDHREGRIGWGASVALRNAFGWDNASAYRPDGCRGRALLSPVCREAVGVGRLSGGFSGPTPAVSLLIHF